MLADLGEKIAELKSEILDVWGDFDPERVAAVIKELETKTGEPEFWNDRSAAEKTLTELTRYKNRIEPWEQLKDEIEDLVALHTLGTEEGDESVAREIEQGLKTIRDRFDKLMVREYFQDELDAAPAFLTIHSGAGGTEACDWVSMLLRMYSRWMERNNFSTTILDLQEAEGGIKSVTIEVKGENAYGYLRCETGIHRLVRISPFDSGGRRHTSFASLYASPVIEDDIDVDIRPEDLRVDTYRASGAGGQHVNKTDSAIRLTHLATGIVVQCQNERSQHKNRDTAMKMLRSRLYDYYRAERDKENAEKADEKRDIGWGNQIRSYVFQPYTMVKDHRTKVETGNVQAVMDGEIDEFITAYLRNNRDGL
ncbi:MAG: peptide chain release factor 2 [Spirochaetia bacterium]